MSVILKVIGEKTTVGIFPVIKGETSVFTAQESVRYQLIDSVTRLAPEQILVKQVGDDLYIMLDKDAIEPSIIIEEYYLGGQEHVDALIIGQTGHGDVYAYSPTSTVKLDDATATAIRSAGETSMPSGKTTPPAEEPSFFETFMANDSLLMSAGLLAPVAVVAVGSMLSKDDSTSTSSTSHIVWGTSGADDIYTNTDANSIYNGLAGSDVLFFDETNFMLSSSQILGIEEIDITGHNNTVKINHADLQADTSRDVISASTSTGTITFGLIIKGHASSTIDLSNDYTIAGSPITITSGSYSGNYNVYHNTADAGTTNDVLIQTTITNII